MSDPSWRSDLAQRKPQRREGSARALPVNHGDVLSFNSLFDLFPRRYEPRTSSPLKGRLLRFSLCVGNMGPDVYGQVQP